MKPLIDPLLMPGTDETAEERFTKSLALLNTPGIDYVEKRGISPAVAHTARVRFDPSWNGRPAVIVPMVDSDYRVCSLHGRYLSTAGKQNKMFTIGPGGGAFYVGDGWNATPIILVEGLFDALSLAMCGYSAVATVGRRAPWLPEVCRDRAVVLAFDGNHPGEVEVTFYRAFLAGAHCCRITPPGRSKDWNTALLKHGEHGIQHWLKKNSIV
jgi:DNA primase